MTKAKTKSVVALDEPAMAPYYDHNKHTCLQLTRSETRVRFIPMDVSNGLGVQKMGVSAFDSRFRPIIDYPVEKAVAHYRRIATNAGASQEAQEALGIVTTLTKQELKMPTTKKAVESASLSKGKAKGPPAKAALKPVPTAKAPRSLSAAQRFKELIMEGKLSDDKIFAKVQKEFDLDDSKRSYVKWYRNDLKKRGENPPEAK